MSAARQLGKQTIAEYVQDEQTLELLRDYGVDHAQGYHVGWPDDPSALGEHIARPRAFPRPRNLAATLVVPGM